MSRDRTTVQKVGDWKQAYDAIRAELTPEALRLILATMEQVEGPQQFRSYIDLARAVMANDRAAGIVAAMLTQSGVSRPTFEAVDGEDS